MTAKFGASHIVMSGGGVKGIAYVGALNIIRQKCISLLNTAGVSVGALIAAIAAAGYLPEEMKLLMTNFEFEKVQNKDILRKMPILSDFRKYAYRSNIIGRAQLRHLLSTVIFNGEVPCNRDEKFLSKLADISTNNALYSGDYIEDWVESCLFKKGIKTFFDLRGGITSSDNPHGYKARMTAVDVYRAKVIVLPYDISYYGINPDKLEVARAIRMSISAPFIFKPVEIPYKKDGENKKTYIIDGGVIDNFPTWLFNQNSGYDVTGLSLSGKRKYFSFDSPINILKSIASIIYDFGMPSDNSKLNKFIDIDTSQVATFDFNLDEKQKEYLYNAGVSAAETAFSQTE